MMNVHVDYNILQRRYEFFAIKYDTAEGNGVLVERDGKFAFLKIAEDCKLESCHAFLILPKHIAQELLPLLVEQLSVQGFKFMKPTTEGELGAVKNHLAHTQIALDRAHEMQKEMLKKIGRQT